MANAQLGAMLRQLRRLGGTKGHAGMTDAQLLKQFVHLRDEAAFEVLVWRHGPGILSLCRRLLRHGHDVEDAFQATFLTLVRKASTVSKRGSVGSWLYKVAYRVAVNSRLRAVKRERHESSASDLEAAASAQSDDARHVYPVLLEEVNRLPEKYRAPIVLCYFQGKTIQETAELLACPFGTIGTRLARARERLRVKLLRRGVTLSAGAVAGLLAREAVALPCALVTRTVQVAFDGLVHKAATSAILSPVVALSEGVVKAMFVTKMKIAAVVILALSAAGTGAGVFSYRTLAADKAASAQPAPPALAVGDVDSPKKGAPSSPEDEIAAARADLLRAEADAARARKLVEILKKRADEAKRAEVQAPKEPQDAVAFIFGGLPITRQELGEFLIARHGADGLESLVNRRIIEEACRRRGITVTPQELETAFATEPAAFKMSPEKFAEQYLKPRHKTTYEWKEDVLRPRLLLTKLCADRVHVSEEDIRQVFEATYGPKVECKMILWPKGVNHTQAIRDYLWNHLQDDKAFDRYAQQQATPTLAAQTGRIKIGRHTTNLDGLEDAAFRLEPGELSPWIDTPEGQVLLKCIKRIPRDRSWRFDEVRELLTKQVRDQKLQQEIPRIFQELRAQAQPRLILKP